MTKQRILEVAAQEFSKHGYAAVSMNNLVKLLDINKATIYYHYKDKQSLYHEVLNSIVENIVFNLEEELKDIKDPKLRLKTYIKVTIERVKKEPHSVSLFMREMASFGSDMDESIIPIALKKVKILEDILKDLPKKDKYKGINPYAIFVMIHGTMDNFFAIHMSKLPFGNEELKGKKDETLDYISEFVSNFIIDAICEEEK